MGCYFSNHGGISFCHKIFIPFFLLFSLFYSFGNLKAQELTQPHDNEVIVEFREPTYSEGILTTEKGGVIRSQNIRIQARNIRYDKKTILAEEDLILEFGNYIIVGDRLEYNFEEKNGKVFNARSSIEPWNFGGEIIELNPDQSIRIINGFFTTSDIIPSEWAITVVEATINQEKDICAKHIKFRYVNFPFFWIPRYKTNLNTIYDSPIKYRVRFGGEQGPRLGLIYEAISWQRFKLFLRLDYRLKRGLGGGIETYYRSADHKTEYHGINYIARDSSVTNPHEKVRYRFEGVFRSKVLDDKVFIEMSYDKLSDKDMPTDYYDKSLEIETAESTQIRIWRQEEHWITNFFTKLRINNFQTINQELPSLTFTIHPFTIGDSGIIIQNYFKGSYLDFKYANNLCNVQDYNSTRFEYRAFLYRPFHLPFCNFIPEIGAVNIFYGNSPQENAKWTSLALFGFEGNIPLHKNLQSSKHILEPYLKYTLLTFPTTPPHKHYIFDIQDGLFRLNTSRFGIRNSFYKKIGDGSISRFFYLDLYGYAFFKTKTLPITIPKIYADMKIQSLSILQHYIETAWDFRNNILDHFNFRTEWTASDNLALSAEYRYRDQYDWRKAEKFNFILESFVSQKKLLHSNLSDKRNTLLFNIYYRFRPNWAFECESRQGWNRRHEPSYNEYEFDLITTIYTAWNVRFSFQHKEDDNRFAIYVNFGINKPDACYPCCRPSLFD